MSPTDDSTIDKATRLAVENNCRVHSSWLTIKLGKMNLSDHAMIHCVLPFVRDLLEKKKVEHELWANIDLAENPLTSIGCVQLLELLQKNNVSMMTVKLYKCQLTDDAGIALANVLATQVEPMQELHLSHNRLTVVSFVALLSGVQRHGGYPRGGSHSTPLWARLEYNNVARPADVLKMVEIQCGIRACLATDRVSCGPWRCVLNDSKTKSTPMIHLFSCAMQKPAMAKSDYDNATVLQLIARFMPNAGPDGGPSRALTAAPTVSKAAQMKAAQTPSTSVSSKRSASSVWSWSAAVIGGTISEQKNTEGTAPATTVAPPTQFSAPTDVVHAPAVVNADDDSTPKAAEAPSANVAVVTPKVDGGMTPHTEGETPIVAPPVKSKTVGDVDVSMLKYQLVDAVLTMQCFACKNFFGHDSENVRMVLAINCFHVFCSECFAATVRKNVNSADVKCRSKQVPCPACTIPMKRSEAVVFQDDDWQVLMAKAVMAEELKASTAKKVEKAESTEKVDKGKTESKKKALDEPKIKVFREQIETSDPLCVNSFLCHFCETISLEPLLTACSHIFCKTCFQSWVRREVEEFKKNNSSVTNIPVIPCPHPDCAKPLRKQDIGSLDSSEADNKLESSSAGAFTVIQRMRNNMQVRCVHHPDHYGLPFGAKAKKLSREMQCSWVGDLNGYVKHLSKCEVENAKEPKGAAGKQHKKKKEIRKAMHPFPAEGEGQLTLRVGDLVEMLDMSDAGWAAGRLVDTHGAALSDAGWFPMSFLIPLCG
eukprot:GEMP01002199.1.p1 GENE.GEMP01002199.1~~GEMP01002199.1.p1  ORF type:complete len:767 (+),score=158.86 GEMP01002199.1:495-2795(+)